MQNKTQAFVEIVVGILATVFFLFSLFFLANHAMHEINLDKQTFQFLFLGGLITILIPKFSVMLNQIRMRFLFLVGKNPAF
jgi:hypothetical protein